MNNIIIPSTHELLKDIDATVFTSVKEKRDDVFLSFQEKKIDVYFELQNLYRLLMAESYQAFSKDKENFDKLPQKEKQKRLKELSKKARPFCKKADARLKGKFRSSFVFGKNIFIRPIRYYKIEEFNSIVEFIVQEKLLVPTIDPLPVIDMTQVESYAKQAIEQGALNYNE